MDILAGLRYDASSRPLISLDLPESGRAHGALANISLLRVLFVIGDLCFEFLQEVCELFFGVFRALDQYSVKIRTPLQGDK